MKTLLLIILPISLFAQSPSQSQIISWTEKKLPSTLQEFREFLSIRNNGQVPNEIAANIVWCKQALIKRKFQVTELSSQQIPHLFAERKVNPKLPTVLVYMQIDGQPVDGTEWSQPDPYQAELKIKEGNAWKSLQWNQPIPKEARIFARSASDSKGPALAFLSAIDVLDQQHITPAFNIKIIMDFQEELGSPSLPDLILEHRELLKAKMVLIMDGTRHVSNLPTLNFGARGIVILTLRMFGPTEELHSGQYGNYAPNPAFKLSKLLAAMKDDSGRVLIPGFYDGIEISEVEKIQLNEMPNNDKELNKRLGIAEAERVGNTYEEALQYPSFNIRGLQAANVGKSGRTIIPKEAIAEIDMRLVKETDAQATITRVRDFILSKGYHEVKGNPTEEEREKFSNLFSLEADIGSKPFRTDLNSPEGKWLDAAMMRAFGKGNYVKQRTTGGSQPIEPFISTLNMPAVSIRFPNPDNNIHAANENLSISAFIEGIEMCLAILTQPSKP